MKPIKDKVMWCIGYDRMCDTYHNPIPSIHGWIYTEDGITPIDYPDINREKWGEGWDKTQICVVVPTYNDLNIHKRSLSSKGYTVYQNKAHTWNEVVTLFVDNSNLNTVTQGYRFDDICIDRRCELKYGIDRLSTRFNNVNKRIKFF